MALSVMLVLLARMTAAFLLPLHSHRLEGQAVFSRSSSIAALQQCAWHARSSRFPVRVSMQMEDGELIPDAIIEAEAKATPMRPLRQQSYVLIGAISAIAGMCLCACVCACVCANCQKASS
jgi:hypothetical protein